MAGVVEMNLVGIRLLIGGVFLATALSTTMGAQTVNLDGNAGGKRFDGIGIVDGGGATSVLLKDYPEPQRSQILDLVYKPKFGASVSALLVEIPGDGNSTQGSMPSHMHTADDLNYSRGYIWWILTESKKRNPNLSLDGTAWSAPGWVGKDPVTHFKNDHGDAPFWSKDTVDYYIKWLQGLRKEYELEMDAIGCRNEKGESLEFAKALRAALNANGFEKIKLHGFDNWPDNKFDFVKKLLDDNEARDSIDILSAHILSSKTPASAEIQAMAAKMNKPIWNSEEHIYLKGFDCAISIVHAFNDNYIRSGATKVVNWYGIAALYPMEPYSEDPAMLLAYWPWSGHYQVREALWGYAHYGQFTQVGWDYLNGGSGTLTDGGTFVTMKSPQNDYSIIIETRGAKAPQQVQFEVAGGLSNKPLCVWRSNATEQFVQQTNIQPGNGAFTLTVDPDSIYSLSTTTGQQKGSFDNIPAATAFPFPYLETFDQYTNPREYGYLPRYTADIADAFEIVDRPEGDGKCLRQMVPVPTISWAPDWQPYTIIGDNDWKDYEVSADVYLTQSDTAGVMGRVNHVGTGYGFIPKGYFLQLSDNGKCDLVVVRGKKDKKKLVGDAEQQAAIRAANDDSEGGEKILATAQVESIGPGKWHTLSMRFDGTNITGLVDGKQVVTATDSLYSHGMAGLLAGADKQRLSMPYFDNLLIKGLNDPRPAASSALPGQSPLYRK